MPLARPEPPDTRVIAHVDLDCFYVQVEQRRNPELKGKPTAVVQYNPFRGGGIIAVGYEARHVGVTRIMRGDDARTICPDINLVQVPVAHGKADLTVYRDAGSEVVEIFSRMGICERASIDEVYLDIKEAAAKRLVRSPPDARDDYSEEVLRTRIVGLVELDRQGWVEKMYTKQKRQLLEGERLGQVVLARKIELNHQRKSLCQADPKGIDDKAAAFAFRLHGAESCEQDPAGVNVREWLSRSFASRSDQLLACGAIIVAELRTAVVKETQFTTSAGIAHNKMLAKLASGMHKPAQQTLIPSSEVKTLLANLPAKKIKNLGGKLGRSLESDLGVKTMGDLLPYTEAKLQDLYGFNTGTWLWRVARGMNGDEVEGRTLPKSHGCGKTFPGPKALKNLDSIRYWLTELSAELQERLDEGLQLHNRRARLLVVHASCHIVGKASNSMKPFPSKSCALRYGKERIASDAVQLFKRSLSQFCPDLAMLSPIKGEASGTSCTWAVTALSVGANNIYEVPAGTGTITRFFGSPPTSSAKEKAMGTAVSSISTSPVSDVSYQAGALPHEKFRLSFQNEEVISLNEPDENFLNSADYSSSAPDAAATFEVEEANVGSPREGDADDEPDSGECELPASPNAYSVLSRRERLESTHDCGSHSQQQSDRCLPYALADRPSPLAQSRALSCKSVKRNLMDILDPSACGHKDLECTRKFGEVGNFSQLLSATELSDVAPDCHHKESMVDCSMGRNPVLELPDNSVGISDLNDKVEVILCSPLELRPVENLAVESGIGQGPGYFNSMMGMRHTFSDGSEVTQSNINPAAAAEELMSENPASVQLPTSSVEQAVLQGQSIKPRPPQDKSNQARRGESPIHDPEEYAFQRIRPQDTGTSNSTVLHQTTSNRSDRPASREHPSVCSDRTAWSACLQSAESLKTPRSDAKGSPPSYPESTNDQDGRHSVNRDELSSGLFKRSVFTRVDELWEKWKSTSQMPTTSNRSLDKGSTGGMYEPDESHTTSLVASPQDINRDLEGHKGPRKRKRASITDLCIKSPTK